MSGISQAWIVSIITIIAALPTIGTLLLMRSQAQKRKLDTQEIAAVYLIFWGFILFVSFQEHLLVSTYPWYLSWGLIILVGLIFTGISAYQIYRSRQNP